MARPRKTERGPGDTDDTCCFDVEPGDHVCVIVAKKFINAFVCDVSSPICFGYEYAVRTSPRVVDYANNCALYEDFNRKWRFGWVQPRTRSELLVQWILEEKLEHDYVWFDLLDGI